MPASDPAAKPGAAKPRALSGIQPTADSFHLGNYLGAIRQWPALQDEFDAFYFIADQHSITMPHDPELLRSRTRISAAQLLAAGLEPDRCTLFVQSHLPEHAQLAWVFNGLTGVGEAERMTQFKDKAAKSGKSGASVGLLTYPILQAADILLYQPQRVPVGEDQRQHLELTRDLAERFNSRYGETFVVPEPYIVKGTAKITDLQDPTKKMSKSSSSPKGIVELLDPAATSAKKIRSAVTDSDDPPAVRFDEEHKPGVSNLLTIQAALTGRSVADVEASYAGKQYGDLKKEVAEVVSEFVTPFQERVASWLGDEDKLDAVLADGAARARVVASDTLAKVYERVGFLRAR